MEHLWNLALRLSKQQLRYACQGRVEPEAAHDDRYDLMVPLRADEVHAQLIINRHKLKQPDDELVLESFHQRPVVQRPGWDEPSPFLRHLRQDAAVRIQVAILKLH